MAIMILRFKFVKKKKKKQKGDRTLLLQAGKSAGNNIETNQKINGTKKIKLEIY